MEDHNQSKNQTKSKDDKKVVELSAEMALEDQTKHKIIDLTDDIDLPADKAKDKSTQQPPKEEVADLKVDIADPSENTIHDEMTEVATPPATDAEDISLASEEESVEPLPHDTVDAIEDEVSTAFDAVADQIAEPTTANVDDPLFDELSDITQEVDEAVGKPDANESEEEEEDQQPHVETEAIEDESLAIDAAELDAALAGDFDDFDEDIIPDQTGVADALGLDPEEDLELNLDDDLGLGLKENLELDLEDDTEDPQDDDIIDLVDIVDPSEIAANELDTTQDAKIIELTQIVDPTEIEGLDSDSQKDEGAPETSDLSDAVDADDAEDSDTPTEIESQNKDKDRDEELSLSAADDELELLSGGEEYPITEDIFDPEEFGNLFDENELAEDKMADAVESPSSDIDLPSEDIDIESIPALDGADDLFDIVDQVNTPQSPEERTYEAILPPAEDIDPAAALDETAEKQDQVIQLSDILSSSREQQPAAEQAETPPEEIIENEHIPSDTEAATKALALDIADEAVKNEAVFEDKKIEAAVEHIIHTKYADKIEQLIANAVEEAVTREIENIKRTLSDSDEPPA